MDVEKKLKDAVEHAAPDIKSRVMEKCKNASSFEEKTIFIKHERNRKRERIYQFIAAAAVLLMVFNVSADAIISRTAKRVDTVVDIDVNPGIELGINKNDEIVTVTAINDDGREILDGMRLEGTQTKVAVNAIVGSMFEHGYLQGETDSILVSVTNDDPASAAKIEQDISENIDVLLKAYNQEVNVISQVVSSGDEELNTMADTYGISAGKAALIKKIIEMYGVYTEEELAYLNITELNEIITGFETGIAVASADDETPADVNTSDTVTDIPDEGPGEEGMVVDPSEMIDEIVPDDAAVSVSENSVSENGIDPVIGDPSVSENTVHEPDPEEHGNNPEHENDDGNSEDKDDTSAGNND